MARRRRITLVVFGLLLVLLVTSAIGLTSWWYELAVGLATAGYVIHLRNEAIRMQEVQRRRRARAARASSAWVEPQPAYRQPVAQPAPREDDVALATPVSAAGTENGSRWEPVPVPLPTYVSKPVVQRPAASALRPDVDATNTIDLTRPGVWTESTGAEATAAEAPDLEIDHRHLLLDESGSGRIASSAGAPASPYARRVSGVPVADEDDELDHILERRRAVGS